MIGRLRTLVYVALALLLGITAGVGGVLWYQSSRVEERPVFALPDLAGERRSIAEWDGEVVLINFWATWCPPCREEIPLLIDLQREYGDRGLQVVGVALDRLPAVRDYAAAMEINYPILHGMGAAMEVQARYGNTRGTLPYTVLVDREGRIRHVFARQVHRADIEPIIREML